ncbi:MAG: AAA family ATPase [Oscillospiraceae bacterium]|nr:AAA family ATPase [Oscillospiraceae bacterium]
MKIDILRTLIDAVMSRDNGRDYTIIAIDGPSATGKTSFCELIADRYKCEIFHMDDFFLTEEEKTEERLSVPGNNVAWERFRAEVLEKLEAGEPFKYQKYNCRTKEFYPSRTVRKKKLYVVEGVYSHHPELEKFYDYKMFFDVTKNTQKERILKRESERKAQLYFNEWIPMEDKYFEAYNIRAKANFVFDSSKAF